MLLDVRETETLRGYHLMAAATLMAQTRIAADLHVLTSGHPEEKIATDVFQFDTRRQLSIWDPDNPSGTFDLYAMMSDFWPEDQVTSVAISCARRTLVGLAFAGPPLPRPGLVSMSAHDTWAFAEAMRRLLPRSRLRRLLGL